MSLNYKKLPVYEQKERILEALKNNQVIVIQSPTGSGKTTQLPVILHEAGYSDNGIIAVTQPRRIATLSVSEFISKQLGTTYPGLVGYKMRFEDKTDPSTRIKIMTDGILLQEMKLDPYLSKYSVVMVDEAHERSLNIDFVLGLLKRVLQSRPDFKVIVSSATINTEMFSSYFDGCPIITIDSITYPVTLVYDPPMIPAGSTSETSTECLLEKISSTVERILSNGHTGDILIFLPGEKIIKDCIRLLAANFGRKLHLIPLYGRLAKEEQEKVFENAPFAKKKVVISTNIAETSITIDGITAVIDSGLAKLNFYNPRTFTSSLNESTVSKASCNQRKGRAGRTQEGICYRLYSRKDFETRQMYTLEEIYRTDLSEVVMRMSELGITDFEQFDFISPPNKENLKGAIETLMMLNALNDDKTLSSVGKLMVEFPLVPRQSRIIVEAIMSYPDVIEEAIIATAFLSTQSPFLLPPGEESDARKAHHAFRDVNGDFVSYIKIYRAFKETKNQEKYCQKNYLDYRVMSEIVNIKEQLEQIVSDMKIPITGGGSVDDYLTCIATGMIQFVCFKEGRNQYRTLTTENIQIHPGSSMFREDPNCIVAGEIVRTSRMFAMSVSPLSKNVLKRLFPNYEKLYFKGKKAKELKAFTSSKNEDENSLRIGNRTFSIEKIKGKKTVILPLSDFQDAVMAEQNADKIAAIGKIKSKIIVNYNNQKYTLLQDEKLEQSIKVIKALNTAVVNEKAWPRNFNKNIYENRDEVINALQWIMRITVAKSRTKELGFIGLFTDGNGSYWFKTSRGFSTALSESLSSLEILIDETSDSITQEQKNKINTLYRILTDLFN